MLKIRLAPVGKKHRRYFRIVLTEHTKPVKSGYMSILGLYDPIKKKLDIKIDEIKKYVNNGAELSSRVAKLAYNESKDSLFEKFFEKKEITRKVRNPNKFKK